MKIRAAIVLGLGLIASCSPNDREVVTRDAARSLVARVVVKQYPAFPVEPATDCILANASAPEIRSLASNTVIGPTAATIQTVSVIAERVETMRCLAARDLPALR
ncbi:hypothetical protein LX81_00992 [Palleronia aestuarii]|uniref:Succinate dehydrogenase n=1 Tax=Palleronia aestuarii TaxID=568105 RepID=A0A2W7P4M7_9RHOB|nr:hypothetical protein [Palleronia aestuarii]PZX18362.1 hypothetical protein LX81_00992 [Palleronia aestuarii]